MMRQLANYFQNKITFITFSLTKYNKIQFDWNNLNVNIASLESQIESEQTSIDNLKVQINSLNKENSIMLRVNEAGYSAEYPLNDDILIVDVPKTSSVESTAQTNWFNDFCEFISSVFGG